MSKALRATREQVEERVELIKTLMRRAKWERGRTNRTLAREWDVSVGTIDDYAAEAGRAVRGELTDKDAVTDTVTAALSEVVRGGLEAGDRKAVVQAADVWTRIVGARAAEKHEHAVVVAQFEALPRAGKVAWLRERARRLTEQADLLEAADCDEP